MKNVLQLLGIEEELTGTEPGIDNAESSIQATLTENKEAVAAGGGTDTR